ncbi:Obg-like ATPase 1 [Haematococcus lacustris]|uniref:Obg-like ATPase 1 n=1 Tax=Haematococcus lacustris TaxID=44745 RepID=A0A699YKZ0_HAELA|nr:Obg-like ATPase 1 [Haematococcus lacustris]
MIYAANVPEDDLADKGANNVHVKALRARAAEEGVQVAVVSAKVESELNELPKEEAKEWLESLGVTDGGLSNLITATYSTLGLRTYFTSGQHQHQPRLQVTTHSPSASARHAWWCYKGVGQCSGWWLTELAPQHRPSAGPETPPRHGGEHPSISFLGKQ